MNEGFDPYVAMVDRAMERVAGFVQPGKYLVDFIPALRHLPPWLPGTGFFKFADICTKELNDLANTPYNFVKEQMVRLLVPFLDVMADAGMPKHNGPELPSYTSRLLPSKDITPEKEYDIKWCAAALYAGMIHLFTHRLPPILMMSSVSVCYRRGRNGQWFGQTLSTGWR